MKKNNKKHSGACDYGPGAGQGSLQTDTQKGALTLNSNRPVFGAGSGIVAGSDRVRRGEEGETGEGGWRARKEAGPGVGRALPPCGGSGGRGGREGIGRFSWGADAQYADV